MLYVFYIISFPFYNNPVKHSTIFTNRQEKWDSGSCVLTNHSACVSQTVTGDMRLLGRSQRAPFLTGTSVARRPVFFHLCATSPSPRFSRVKGREASDCFTCSSWPHGGDSERLQDGVCMPVLHSGELHHLCLPWLSTLQTSF